MQSTDLAYKIWEAPTGTPIVRPSSRKGVRAMTPNGCGPQIVNSFQWNNRGARLHS